MNKKEKEFRKFLLGEKWSWKDDIRNTTPELNEKIGLTSTNSKLENSKIFIDEEVIECEEEIIKEAIIKDLEKIKRKKIKKEVTKL